MMTLLIAEAEEDQAGHATRNGQPENNKTRFRLEAATVTLGVDVCDEVVQLVLNDWAENHSQHESEEEKS